MLEIRSAVSEDCQLYWEWANEAEVRASAFSSEPTPWEAHVSWFQQKLADPNAYLYVVTDESKAPIAQVRFDVRHDREAEVDVSVAREQRGHGYGARALQLACERLFRTSTVTCIVAYVKRENVASQRAFGRAGFALDHEEQMKGHATVCMKLMGDRARERGRA